MYLCVHGSQDTIFNRERANAIGRNNGLENVVCYDNQTYAREPEDTGDVCCTLQAHCGTGGNVLPFVHRVCPTLDASMYCKNQLEDLSKYEAVALAENTIGRQPENGGNGTGYSKELCYTMNATGVPGVSYAGFVRRLTTVECARLQGFPDHHTEIPWRGKEPSECPDGPQYKAYGNSMCVNVIEWLGKRIEHELNNPKPLTLYLPEQMEFDF